MRAENSRLRKYLWESIHKKFSKIDLYDKKILPEEDLQKLLSEMLDDGSEFSVGNVLRTVFKVDSAVGKKELSLLEFTHNFILYSGESGLKNFNSLRTSTENFLNIEDFYPLFLSSFRALDSSRIRESYLKQFFTAIDSNKDGKISVEEYEQWIKDFLSNPHPLQNQRKRYYFNDDDLSIPTSGDEPIIPEAKEVKIIKPEPLPDFTRVIARPATQRVERNLPKFTKTALADEIINHTIDVLAKYDINHNNNFEIQEIQAALKDLLKSQDDEVFYGTYNDFRYNMERVEIVSYEAIAKFFLACHFGEITIKRMHRKQMFSKGEERKMNQEEFSIALADVLEIVHFSIHQQDLVELFAEIDRDNDSWITYAEFFEFLRIFFKKKQTRISINIGNSTIMDFGSEGAIGETIHHKRRNKINHKVRRDVNNQWKSLLETTQAESANFAELIRKQIKAIIKRIDLNESFEKNKDSLSILLYEIFEKSSGEVEFAIRNTLKYKKALGECLTYDELVGFLIEIQFGELSLDAFKSKKNLFGTNFKINLEDFISLITDSCYYLGLDPLREELETLFKGIDKNEDGFISVHEFLKFVKIYLAGNVDVDDLLIRVFEYALVKHEEKETKKIKMKKELAKMIPLRRGQSKQVKEVVTQLYTDLKLIFDKYDHNNDEALDDKELEGLLRGVLKENSQQELDYIFWNMFRIDKKGKGAIEFQDFAPFILKHSAEITLQRFHSQQKSGKSHLDLEEFKHLMNNAFHFISAIKKDNLANIFGELDKDKDNLVAYKEFLGWILTDIAPRVR